LTEILTDYSVRQKMLHICGQYFWRDVMARSVKNFDGRCTSRQKFLQMRLHY